MASKYLDAYLQQKAGNGRKQDEENKSTSSTGRGAGSAATSGRSGNGLDFLQRLQNETRNLYSRQQSGTPGAASPAGGTGIQGSLYAQIAKQMRGTQRPNLYSGTTPQSPAATAPLTQGSQYSQPQQPAAMPGLTGAQRQMIAERNTAPTMTYSQILQRNMDVAASGGDVTPEMVAELRQADERRREEQRERLRQLNADIYAASENLYTPQVQMTTTDRRELNNGVTDSMGISDVKAALPGLQESFEYAKDRYQRLMDRNIRMANETGAVSPEMVAELYQAERDKNEADRRYQEALARNEQMSYSERMGNTRTDLTQVAELLAMRAEVNPQKVAREDPSRLNAAREEYQQLNDRISAVEESLRQEGYSNAEIQSLFSYLTRERNAAEMEERTEEWRQAAAERGSLGNLGINVGSGLLSGVGYLDLALQNAFAGQDAITGQRRRVDYNTGAQNAYFRGEATMQGEMDKLLEKYGEVDENGEITGMNGMGNFRAGAYQLAVSMGESAAVAGLQAVGVPAAMLLLSGSAATQTTHQMHEQGFSDGASLLMGGIAGAAEYVTEKIGMDQLFKTRDVSTAKNVLKTVLQNFVNQSLAEGGEEVLSTVINTLADVIVNGDKSELETRYRELMAQGMTQDQAQKIAAREWLSGVWNDFYMGAISGGLFSVGGMTFQTGRNAIVDSRTGREIVSGNALDQLIEQINTLDGDIAQAANVPESFNTQSNREVGGAARAMERAQVMENMRAELEARGEENVSPELLSGMYASSQQEPQRLTGEERKALRGSETAMELVREWSDQWGDNSVPAPFEGLEDILRSQMEQKENAPQEGATEEGATNGEQGIDGTPENGNDGVRAGEQGTGIPELGEEGAVPGGEGQVRESVSEGRGENLRSVTLQELGVTNAAEGTTITVQDENSLTGPAASAAQQVRQLGMEPVAYQGDMIVNGASVNGYIENGKVFFRTDAKYRDGTAISPEAIVRHESVHNAKDSDPGIIDIGMEIVRQNRSEAEVLEMMDAYRETYKDLYDFEKMSEEDITDMLVEEIVADAYAGMNYFRDGGETVEQVRAAIGNQVESAQSIEGQTESTGPPEGRDYSYPTDADALYTREDLYSYDFLTHQEDMKKLELPDVGEVISLTPKQVAEKGMEDVANYGPVVNTKENGKMGFVKNKYTGHTLRISESTIRHSLHKERGLGAQILNKQFGSIIGQAAENAIPINGLKNENTQAAGTYAMAGYATDNKGNEYIAILTVEHYTNQVLDAEVVDVGHSISGRINKNQRTPAVTTTQESPDTGLSFNTSSDTITIADLLDVVNSTHRSILSKDVLERLGEVRPKDGYYTGRALFSAEVGENNTEERKQRQAELILKNNPHDDSLGEHTWIRSAEDVHTYEEGLAEDGIEAGDNVAPDYTAGMIEEAKRTGQITVYSSHQIGTGTFVTPSAMEAKSYAGDGPIYSKTIRTEDVAWLDSIQGQYAPVAEKATPGQASAEVTPRISDEERIRLFGEFENGDINNAESYDRMERDEAVKYAKDHNYPMLRRADGREEQAVPGWTWVRDNQRKNYGRVIGDCIVNGQPGVEVEFYNKKKGTSRTLDKLPSEVTLVDPKMGGRNVPVGEAPAETGTTDYVEDTRTDEDMEATYGQNGVTQAEPIGSKKPQKRESLREAYKRRTEAYLAAMNRNDTEFDYQGEGRWIAEAERRLQKMGENDTSFAEQSSAPSPQGEGSEMEAARAELLDVGEATVRNETGTYIMKVRLKGDRYQSQIFRNGVLDKSQTFPSAEEAADYAVDWVNGRTSGQIDAELYEERSEQKEKPGPHWPTGKEYGEEIVRQKQNKAADMKNPALKRQIQRTTDQINEIKRLDRNPATKLTPQQRAKIADLEETRQIMNDELTSRQRKRAEKKKRAKTKPAVENRPTRSAADAKNALMEQFHTAAGEQAEVGRQIEAKLNEIARSGRITDENRQALYDLLIENGVVPKHAESTYQEIRNSLRGQRIFVNEQERADLGDDFETLRRRAWANGIYLTNNPNDGKIDTVNMEMAEAFGENLFPTNEALSDMLSNMIDQAERGRTVQQSLHESIQGEARETGRSANEIYGEMFSQMDETLRTFAEKAGLEVALKDRTATQLAEERQRWEDRLERRAQARRESEIRGKVLRGLQRLSKLRGKAGPEIRAQVDEVLKDIDTQARQLTLSGLENLQDLQRAYLEAREKHGYVDEGDMGNWIPNPYVEKRLESLTKKHVNDMSLEEVVDLGRTVAGLENAIRTQNQMIGEEFDATIEESAKGVREDVESSRGAKAGFLHKWLMEEHLSPRRFLDMLGGWKTDGTMSKLSKSLEDGQTRMLDFQRRAVQSFDPFLSKKTNRQWLERASGKKAEWTSYEVLDGYSEDGGSYKTIELTPMMKISLYLHSRNMDNLRHIQTGGIVIPNKALYQKGKMAEAYAQGERIRMNPETVRKIAGELTETERTFANHMITLFDNISKDAINEVSLQLDGFERAGVENYMPIETDRSFLKSDVAGEARAATVEGIGSIANERVHASNPIMLSDASDVLMRQIDKVSRYYGYAIPIRNFQAVNNFVFHEEGAPFSTSIKEIMDRKWGSGAEQYITKMLEDLQSSGRRGDMMSSALAKLRGKLAGATLTANPSVAFSQTASYPGAAQAVGWDGLAHGLVAGRVDPKLIEKYSPLYWYRNQGNSTQELGDYMNGRTLGYKMVWFLGWIQKMDSATIRRLWAASEYRVSKDNPGLRPGSQADIDAGKDVFYQKVAEVFNRAVYDTQPNYTNMERAQILRSNSDVTRFLTMYKTVPLQYYGMMVEATGRLQAAMKSGDQAKITEARKYAVNTFGGLLAANTVYVAMKALFKGIRRKDKDYRDEEGNLTAGSVAAQLGKDLAETYAGSIIGGAEMYSVAESLLTGSKFYGPEMSALSYVEDMVGAVNSIFKSIGEEDPRKAAGAIKDAAVTLAQGFGVPAQNVETYLLAGVRWMFPDVAMEYDNLFGGIERGDMKGMDEQAVGTATNLILQNRTGLKIDQSVTDELARLYSVGELAAIPTNTPSSFSYNGKTVQISDRGAYSDTWGGIVGDNLEDLVTTDDYVSADDGQRAALVNKLYQYATVEARRGADPEYSAEGNSTYGWTVKADEAVEAGVGLVDAICALDAFSHMTADKDENGNSISGSKKAKVCDYIDAMDITDEQKDVMYLLSGYKENSLEYTPWHGWDEDEEDGSGSGSRKGSGSGKSSGGKKGRGGGSRKAAAPKEKAVKGSGSKIQLPKVSSGSGTGAGKAGGLGKGADASLSLIQIIDRYYGGNALAAAMDGGARARGRTTVDFEL